MITTTTTTTTTIIIMTVESELDAVDVDCGGGVVLRGGMAYVSIWAGFWSSCTAWEGDTGALKVATVFCDMEITGLGGSGVWLKNPMLMIQPYDASKRLVLRMLGHVLFWHRVTFPAGSVTDRICALHGLTHWLSIAAVARMSVSLRLTGLLCLAGKRIAAVAVWFGVWVGLFVALEMLSGFSWLLLLAAMCVW